MKFNKRKCRKCKYHGRIQGGGAGTIFCNYAGIREESCLKRESGKVTDRRGDDWDNCRLYSKGASIRVGWNDMERWRRTHD